MRAVKPGFRRNRTIAVRHLTLALGLAACLTLGISCQQVAPPTPRVPGGDADRGIAAIQTYGCGACHTIDGVPGAHSQAGSTLENYHERAFIAGRLANEPDNLVKWIQSPQEIKPGVAMPDLGVTPQDARDIAAYLYSK